MRLKLLLPVFLATVTAPLTAQTYSEQSESRIQNPPISYEAVALFNSDSARMQLNIHYRIAQNFFIFVRNETAPQTAPYAARGELLVELLNDQKVSVAREIRQLPLTRTTLPSETDRPPGLQGVVSLTAPAGKYTIVFIVDDRESGRTFAEKTRKVTLLEPKPSSFEVSDLMISGPSAFSKTPDVFVPMNRGGGRAFLRGRWNLDGSVSSRFKR